MNVYITHTPEFPADKVDEVISLLQGIPGELKFVERKQLTKDQYKLLDNRFEDFSGIDVLSFKEYFNLVDRFRTILESKNDDFVIMITTIQHNLNWFSGFKNKDIFVRGGEWDIISNVDSKFGIAHQCIENIFQSLMGLDILNYKTDPNIHMEAIGCINDFCRYKPDILKKLKSADICESCDNRFRQNGGSDIILSHIISIIEKIRKEFVISKRFTDQLKLDIVKVDSDGKISIGNNILELDVLPRVLYIGFLKHLEGLQNNKLCENRKIFEEIYPKVKTDREPDPDAVRNMVCKKSEIEHAKVYHKPTFETYRSKVKGALIKSLGKILSDFYHIKYVEDQNHNMLFKVALSKGLTDIDKKFTD